MKLLCLLLSALLCTVPAFGQSGKEKPVKLKPLPKGPAEAIVGLWHGTGPAGDEYMTFTADGRAILQRGPGESMNMKYVLDTSATPWKLDMSGEMKGVAVTIFTVFEFPAADQFRMARPSPDREKRPDANALKESKLVMERIKPAGHDGIYQIVEMFLKKMAGTWEGKDGGETITLTFTEKGEYTMKVADFTDKGRFSIHVRSAPYGIDLVSSEGAGAKYSVFTLTAEGNLQVGSAGKSAAERPQEIEEGTARVFKRKAEPAAEAKPK